MPRNEHDDLPRAFTLMIKNESIKMFIDELIRLEIITEEEIQDFKNLKKIRKLSEDIYNPEVYRTIDELIHNTKRDIGSNLLEFIGSHD